MYSTNNGDVNLNVGLDTGSAKKDALQLAKSIVDTFKGADKSIQSQSSSMQSLENRITKTSDKLAELRNKQTELAKQQIPTEQYTQLANDMSKVEKQLDKLGEKSIKLQSGSPTNKAQKQLQDIETEADKLQTQYTYLEESMNRLKTSGGAYISGTDTKQYQDVTQQIKYTESEMEVLKTKHDELTAKQNKVVSGADRIRNAFAVTKGVVSKLVTGVKRFATAGKKSFDNINKSTKRGIFTLLKYTLGIRSLFILFRRLRSAATEALKAMGQKFPEVQKDLNNLKSAFTGFKASIGTAFQPLLAAATPVLVTIINLATKAANAIGSLFAALTGQDYVYKATAANNNYANSVSDVGKAAKEANKQLGEYDELMVIQSDNDSGGSGGGGGAAGNGMEWEKVPVENSIKDLADRIKQAWKDADFTDIGKELGTKIKDALDNIKWDELKETAEKVGKSLATFLNGFFQSGVLASTGTAISEALNTAIRGALGFVNNFDWGDNGVEFGKMFNNLVAYFDEHAFAELIANTIKGALDFVTGFFTEADFRALGQKIGSFLSDLTMEIPEITVKIAKLAWTIAKDAAGFIAGVNDTNPFLVDLLGMLGLAKIAGAGFAIPAPVITIAVAKVGWDIGNTIYENLGKDENGMNIIDHFVESSGIGELAVNIADVFDDIANNGVKGFWEGFKNALKGIYESIKKWINDYIVEPWKEVLEIHSPSAVFAEIGENVIEGFKQGVLNAINGIEEWLNTNVISKITEAWDKVKELTTTIKGKIDDTFTKVKEAWGDIKETVKDLFATARGKVEDSFTGVKETWNNLSAATKELLATARGKIDNTFNTLKTTWESIKDKGVIATAEGVIEQTFTDMKAKWDSVKDKTIKLSAEVATKWKDIKDKWANIYDNFKGKTAELSFSLDASWSDFKKKYNNFIGHFKNKTFKIKAKFSASAANLKAWINNNVFSKINSKLSRVPILSSYFKNNPLRLAKGAVIPPNKEFMAILGDQKQGTNIETPLDTMIEAFDKALDRRGGSDSNKEPIVLQLDGRDIVRLVWDEQDKRYKQTGKYTPRYS